MSGFASGCTNRSNSCDAAPKQSSRRRTPEPPIATPETRAFGPASAHQQVDVPPAASAPRPRSDEPKASPNPASSTPTTSSSFPSTHSASTRGSTRRDQAIRTRSSRSPRCRAGSGQLPTDTQSQTRIWCFAWAPSPRASTPSAPPWHSMLPISPCPSSSRSATRSTSAMPFPSGTTDGSSRTSESRRARGPHRCSAGCFMRCGRSKSARPLRVRATGGPRSAGLMA